jgi:hypothetical protein
MVKWFLHYLAYWGKLIDGLIGIGTFGLVTTDLSFRLVRHWAIYNARQKLKKIKIR